MLQLLQFLKRTIFRLSFKYATVYIPVLLLLLFTGFQVYEYIYLVQ